MKKKDLIYIDTNIFITYYTKRGGFEDIQKFFKENHNLEVQFITSDWTLTEIVKVLTNEYKEKPKKVASFIEELQREKRIFGTKFAFTNVSGEKEYDFGEFFFHIQKIILEYNNGYADAIHSLIMRNNKIKYILTTDVKGFDGIKGIKALNPLEIIKNDTTNTN
jgi:predicted nucleic acid-binding protein